MGKIALEGMEFYAYHGFYEEERIIGNKFVVDVFAETDLDRAAMTDSIRMATNYENIFLVVRYEMEKPSQLLEHVGQRIAQKVKQKVGGIIQSVNVIIRKCNPPLGGRVKYSVVETSGRIGLEGMEFIAPVGSTYEERLVANEFVANVYVSTNFKKATVSDDLNDTLNYEAIYWATKTEIEEPAQLLENVAYRIASNLKSKYNHLKSIEVQLKKKYPPVRGQMPEAKIEMDFNHQMSCPRCNRKLLCYQDENCWCNDYQVMPATQRMLDLTFGDCLCENCMKEHGKKIK